MTEFVSNMGDGSRFFTTRGKALEDIHAGSGDAVDCTGVPELNADEMERICDIICCKDRVVGVEPGNEVIMTEDFGANRFGIDSGTCGNGVEIGRREGSLIFEKSFSMDTFELGHTDYSIKAVKPIIAHEMQTMEQLQMLMTIPLLYGAMPNMGLYYKPDGPYGNPADLMREYQVEEAMEAAESAADHMSKDIEFVSVKLQEAGCDGFDFDTTGSAGDADFVGTLKGVAMLRKARPEANIIMGMAGENILGIHGSIEYDGKAVAGMYPHEQVKLAEKVGVNIFGPVVNTNCSKSLAWNIARAVAITKHCVKTSNIPIHPNMGMGVGGIPMSETPPIEAATRASKAMIDLAKADGI
jgi:dimethylamine--corrinoid protein Co-methyltransferase